MMARAKKDRLLTAAWIELTSSVVDVRTLEVVPFDAAAATDGTATKEETAWLNGGADHQLLLRTAKPVRSMGAQRKKLFEAVRAMNSQLAAQNRMLLPGGAHPFYSPATGKGDRPMPDHYGQALRMGFSFANDDDFAKLHAAMRVVLPILPALTAASPVVRGSMVKALSSRSVRQQEAFKKWPALIGPFIPEALFNQEDYYRSVFTAIAKAMTDAMPGAAIDHQALNARAATPDFDLGVLTIHIVDAQESVSADLAVAELVHTMLTALCKGKWMSNYVQRAWDEGDLLRICTSTLHEADEAVITNAEYLRMFGLQSEQATARTLWTKLVDDMRADLSPACQQHIDLILKEGCLARRIARRAGSAPSRATIVELWGGLGSCLAEDKAFV